jgi:hypothetical protein
VAVLVDGHCHTVLASDVDRPAFELACSEATLSPPAGVSYVDSQIGLAVRRWCAPVLDLPAHAPIDEYLAQRSELGWSVATTRLLRAAQLGALLVDTGLDAPDLLAPAELEPLAGAPVHEVVRLERVAEGLAGHVDAAGFAEAYERALAVRTSRAVAVKSIVAYRYGLDIPPARPSTMDIQRAAGTWLQNPGRLRDPVLLRFLLWAGIDTGLPVQLHTGFGDRSLALHRADPALLQPFLQVTRTPIVLLHGYPYHRQAGWLAQVYPHVYLDVGLTVTHLGARAETVLAEFLELAPFGKVLFSTDAYLLPELYLVGAAQYRHSLRRVLDRWLADDALTTDDVERIEANVNGDNARRVYGL